MSTVQRRIEPAPSAPIARAARAFGDDYPPAPIDSWMRVSAVALALASAWYLPWLFTSLNRDVLWLALPFALANTFTVVAGLLSVANSWHRSVPDPSPLPHGAEPLVGLIIPTCGEPVPMILRTL